MVPAAGAVPTPRQLAELGQVLQKLPSYLRAERRDRGTFLRAVYRRYAGADLAALEQFVDTELAPHDPQPAVAGGRSAGSGSTGPPATRRS